MLSFLECQLAPNLMGISLVLQLFLDLISSSSVLFKPRRDDKIHSPCIRFFLKPADSRFFFNIFLFKQDTSSSTLEVLVGVCFHFGQSQSKKCWTEPRWKRWKWQEKKKYKWLKRSDSVREWKKTERCRPVIAVQVLSCRIESPSLPWPANPTEIN